MLDLTVTFDNGPEPSVTPHVLDAGSYELRVSGAGPVALTDLAGQPIDGDGDGAAGGDFVLRFTVETTR